MAHLNFGNLEVRGLRLRKCRVAQVYFRTNSTAPQIGKNCDKLVTLCRDDDGKMDKVSWRFWEREKEKKNKNKF
jgi:hypothetical protein